MTVASTTIGDIAADLRSGFASGEEDPNGIVQFRMNNVGRTGEINWDKLRRVPSSKMRDHLAVQAGDILFNATNSPELVGKTALFLGFPEPVTFSNHFIRIRTKSSAAEPAYLARWLQKEFEHGRFAGMCRSWVNQASITKDQLTSLSFPLPPLNEQRRMAAILDKADAVRRKRRRAFDLLNNLTHAIFREIFGDPRENSHRNPVIEVGNVTDCIVPGRDKPKSFTGSIPWVTTAELARMGYTSANCALLGLTETEIAEVKARVVPAQSVLMTCVGDLGVVSIAEVPMVINQQLHSFQCSDRIIPEYLMYALSYQTDYMRGRATQTTLPYMNKTICNSVPIQLPHIDKQMLFRHRVQQINGKLLQMSRFAEKAEDLFFSLQHRAFSGQL